MNQKKTAGLSEDKPADLKKSVNDHADPDLV
jgi:hypothetical protein